MKFYHSLNGEFNPVVKLSSVLFLRLMMEDLSDTLVSFRINSHATPYFSHRTTEIEHEINLIAGRLSVRAVIKGYQFYCTHFPVAIIEIQNAR